MREKRKSSFFYKLRGVIERENTELFTLLRHAANENKDHPMIEVDHKIRFLLENLLRCISTLNHLLVSKGRKEVSFVGIRNALTELRNTAENATWVEEDENGVLYIKCCPKDIGKRMHTSVWQKERTVLTSGTMSDGADFEFFKRENGINRLYQQYVLESCVPSPFAYRKNTRLYIPEDLPTPDNNDATYITVISDRIVELVEATKGHTAILFTSYKALWSVYEETKERLEKYEVICMTRTNKTAIADFQKCKNGVLFASGSMWEGVDCVGDALSSVIIVRLPFPRRSFMAEQKKSSYKTVREFVWGYAVPEMLIKLRQGAGRLIRNETDTGVISILDARASRKGRYRTPVMEALYKYPLVTSVADVAAFMHEVKAKEYFQ